MAVLKPILDFTNSEPTISPLETFQFPEIVGGLGEPLNATETRNCLAAANLNDRIAISCPAGVGAGVASSSHLGP